MISDISAHYLYDSTITTRSTSFSRLDCKVTIPANCWFVATVKLFYINADVTQVGIGEKTSYDAPDFDCRIKRYNSGNQYVHYPCVTWASYTGNDPLTVYAFGSWSDANINTAQISAVYWPIPTN